MNKSIKLIFFWLLSLSFVVACSNDEDYEYYPKPISGQKVSFPEKSYQKYTSDCQFSFDIPTYANIDTASEKLCNANLIFPDFKATLFLTYVPIDTNLFYNIEYSRKLAYEHSIMADAIEEAVVKNEDNHTYGMKYRIKGDAASNYQFYVTDSNANFLRGALYFNTAPNYDSLKPSLDYMEEDFDHLINSIEW